MTFAIFDLLKEVFAFAGFLSDGKSLPKPLSPEEEKKYVTLNLEGDKEARNKLIEHNMRLVVHITKKYDNLKVDNDDLISIGTIGLIKAVNTYNTGKGTALATYAARCIENEILMAIRTTKKQNSEVSLNEPIGVDKEGNEISLMDILDSPNEGIPEQVDLKMQKENLYALLKRVLSERERFVLELRFGLYGGDPLTQREIAQKLGISRSYVSRIEKKAIDRLSVEIKRI